MTVEEIDQLPGGRELDLFIAEKVMGWTDLDSTNDVNQDFVGSPPEGQRQHHSEYFVHYVPHYSTEIAAAWLVVEKLTERPNIPGIAMRSRYSVSLHGPADNGWSCWIQDTLKMSELSRNQVDISEAHLQSSVCAIDQSPMIAICRAALKTVMGGKE